MRLSDAYSFTFLLREYPIEEGLSHVDLYHFKSIKSNLWYIVRVECYECHIYGVKFYQKNHRLSKDKYRILSNTFEPRRIVNTCINIMLSVYESDKNASFGFIGSNSIGEGIRFTKRFRFYSRMMATYFGTEIFLHKENIEKSTYMLINKSFLSENPNLISDIESFFLERYDYFD